MTWDVEFHTDFVPEFDGLDESVQDELLAHVALLETFGPQLGRPRVDTLKGSRHANMKELRFAFAFDPRRQAIVLCGGDKSGGSQRRFYRRLTAKADDRFDAHLSQLGQGGIVRSRSGNRKRRT
jgi:hypothetical protein